MEHIPNNSAGVPTIRYSSRRRQWGVQTVSSKQNNDHNETRSNVPSDISKETPSPVPVVPPSPIAVQADVYSLLSGKLSAETRRAYMGDLRHFLTFINHPNALEDIVTLPKVLARVDRNTATAYRDHMMLSEKRSAATVNRRLTTINIVFNALCEEGIIDKNPFSWVKRPKVGNVGKTPAFTKEQAERIILQPDPSTALGQRDRIILLLLFFCGLRRSEVVKVESGDFYQDQGHMLLKVHGKGRGDKSDVVMVPDRIWPEIQDFIKDKDGLLFTAQSRNGKYNRTDKPISSNRVYLLFKQYSRKAGIDADAFSPHSTRATFITLSLAGGADVRSVMYAARHSDPSTTIRYDRQRMDLANHASQYLDIQNVRWEKESSK